MGSLEGNEPDAATLGTGKQFDVVICNNDEMARTIEAMKALKMDLKKIP